MTGHEPGVHAPRAVEPIHGSIVAAICVVQSQMGAVRRDQRNGHGGYQFASTDAIYAEIARLMAGAGLVILALEDEPPRVERHEKEGKTAQWLRVRYRFVLATAEATWSDGASTRTLYIQVTGPQSFQAAESYATKAFLRGLFKIPTGDFDLDTTAQAETDEGRLAINGTGQKRQSSRAAKANGGTEVFNSLIAQVRQAPTVEVLSQMPDLYADEVGGLPRAWASLYQEEYELRMEQLRGSRQ